MTVADNIKPFPDQAKYEAWSRVQTKSVGDKISTGLGKSLSKAQAAYSLLQWNKLDVKRYEHDHGEIKTLAAAEVARHSAQLHFRTSLQPAIRALEDAKAKATEAGKNVIISKERKAQAKTIATALAEPIRVLKAIHINDFAAAVAKI